MKKIKKMKKILLALIVFLIVLTGTYSTYKIFFTDKAKKDTADKEKPADEKPATVVKKLKIVDLDSNSRSIAVMINNNIAAIPVQAGLQDAYLVYEIVVEGGITRMMAVFKDKDTTKIGSVRSSRHYYLDYALENDAIYVHFGGSPQAYADIPNLGIANIDGMSDSGFWRDKTLNVASEHTAFTSIAKIEPVIAQHKYRATTTKDLLLNYNINEIDISAKTGAITANKLSIPYTSVAISYNYDVVNKTYNRFYNNKANLDYVTKLQYNTKNIIVSYIKNYYIDEKRQGLENIGTGSGYYITDGYAVPITWSKTSRSNQTVYKYLDGTEITVNDGNTFIQIVPIEKAVTIN